MSTYTNGTTEALLATFRQSQFPMRRQLAADYDALRARLAEVELVLSLTRAAHAQAVQALINNGWALDEIYGWHRPTDSAEGGAK